MRVRLLLKSLARAVWRNVDVRVLVGTSDAKVIQVANSTAYSTLEYYGVPVRRFLSQYAQSLHSKSVIVDDQLVVAGSHNWSPGAAESHDEDSLAVFSRELNLLLRDEFSVNWLSSAGAGAASD